MQEEKIDSNLVTEFCYHMRVQIGMNNSRQVIYITVSSTLLKFLTMTDFATAELSISLPV